jgi:hypothetical protein
VAASTAGGVWGVLRRYWGSAARKGGRDGLGYGGGSGAFGFSGPELLVPSFYEGHVLVPILQDILSTENVFQFLAQAPVEGGPLCSIIPVEVRSKALEFCEVCGEVSVSLIELSNSPFSSVDTVGVTVGFLQGSHKVSEGFQIDVVIFHQVEHLLQSRSIESGEGVAEF